MRSAALAFALVTSLTTAAQAQENSPAAVDSLRQRLEDLESMVEMLREQLATESGTAVRTRSRIAMELHGRVLVNALRTSSGVNNADVPQFATRIVGLDQPGGNTMSMRQTTLGFAVSSPDIFGADFSGDLDVDFFGGQFGSSGGRHFPLMRLRTARAALMWDRFTLMAGQEQPLIADVDPISLAAVGAPGFTAAGNLWLWLPQVRATYETAGRLRMGIQAAVLAPMPSGSVGTTNTIFDSAERTGQPTLQGRISARWGPEESAGEIGIGVHHGRIKTIFDSTEVTSSAVALSGIVPITRFFELRGEFFDGQALAGLGGGGIGQGINLENNPVRTRAGWTQLNVKPNERWTIGAGVGIDEPDSADVTQPTDRQRNEVLAFHAQWWPVGPIVVGAEWRRIATRYATGTLRAEHLNLAFGFVF